MTTFIQVSKDKKVAIPQVVSADGPDAVSEFLRTGRVPERLLPKKKEEPKPEKTAKVGGKEADDGTG